MRPRGKPASAELAEWRRVADERAEPPHSDDAAATELDAGSVRVLRLVPPHVNSEYRVLYLHGGGFRRGSVTTYAAPLSRIARHCGVPFYAVEYRLAPENPFPAALEDAFAAYRWLASHAGSAESVIIAGDSAGGGLAAALLLKIAEEGLPRPGGAALFSPWVDLRLGSASYNECATTDRLFSLSAAREAAEGYLAGAPADDRFASPVLGDWSAQAPMLIQASELEVLRDDAIELARVAGEAGCAIDLVMFPDTQHIWHLEFPRTPQSVAAIDRLRDFVRDPAADDRVR